MRTISYLNTQKLRLLLMTGNVMEGSGMVTKIFLYGAYDQASMGVRAMAISIMTIVDRFVPHAQFTIISKNQHLDHKYYDQYNFNLKIAKCGVSRVGMLFAMLKESAKADVVIVIGGDGFSEAGGIYQSLGLLLMTFMKKPVIFFPSSIGPYNAKFTRFLARLSFNRVKSIIAREEITKNYLQEIGINKPPVYLTADAAFILKPAPPERVQEIFSKEGVGKGEEVLIGMNISQLVNYKSKNFQVKHDYIGLMAQLADYLVDNLNATVIFVPHEILPKEVKKLEVGSKRIGGDDITAIKETFEKVNKKHKVIPIVNEYTAAELKGIIGQCDLFIGARMHANIAAISMYVPTVAIAYSHKAPGIMRMVGLEKYICDFRTMTFEELTGKMEDMWSNREKIKREMIPKIENLKESVWFNGKLVKDLLDSSKISQEKAI